MQRMMDSKTMQRRMSNGDKIVGYISVLKRTRDIGEYHNQEYVTAINSIKAKMKDAQDTKADKQDCESRILSEGAIEIFTEILVEQLSKQDHLKTKGTFSKDHFIVISRTLDGLNALIESSERIALATVQKDGDWKLLPILKTLLESLSNYAIVKETSEFKDVLRFLKQVIIMLYNLVMHDNAQIIQRVSEMGLIEIIRPYTQHKSITLKMFSFLFILYVSNEAEACTDETIIKQLLHITIAAVENEKKEANGFQSLELLRALEKSSTLAANKDILYRLGVIEDMAQILETTTDNDEMKSCLYILTNMAFIKTELKDAVSKEINDRVRHLIKQKIFQNKDAEVVKAGQCLNWVLEEQSGAGSSNGYQTSTIPSQDRHIMISYNWGSQTLVRKIKTYLKEHNFKIWYDEDEIVGDALQAMAAAVEDSWLLLVCISRKYKQSTFCQMEAQYAAKLKIGIVPVRVEDYEPDGWLGILTNTLLYYNFFDGATEENLSRLAKALRTMGENANVPQMIRPITTVDGTASSIGSGDKRGSEQDMIFLLDWEQSDLDEWFSKIGVDRQKLGVDKGADIRTLIRMRAESPRSFYEYMFSVKLSLPQITNFIDGFEELKLSRRNQ